LDEQRYCEQCKGWFHVECLGKPKEKPRVKGPMREQLVSLPIFRGWLRDPPEDWMTVGSGRLIKKAKELYQQGQSQNWERELDGDFVRFSTTTPSLLQSYTCPHCKSFI
jgi:hypothetical protein